MENAAQVTQVISSQNISYMAIEICVAVLFPIVLMVGWKKKKKTEWMPFFAGACVYFAFAIVARQVLDLLFLGMDSVISRTLSGSVGILAVYSAFLTGILEETGRFVCFRYVLNDDRMRTTAVSYGIGHGGLESMYVLGYTVLSYFILAMQLNGVGMEVLLETIGSQDPEPYLSTIEGIQAIGVTEVLLASYERILFMVFQISLSVLVFCAVHLREKFYWFPLSILLHIGMEIIAASASLGFITSLPVIEVLLTVFAAVTAFLAFRQYTRLLEK